MAELAAVDVDEYRPSFSGYETTIISLFKIMATAFCVSGFAETTLSSKTPAEATRRALSLYRKFQKSVSAHELSFGLMEGLGDVACFFYPFAS